MAYGLPELKTPDFVGDYARGSEYGRQKKEQERKQPILEQMEQIKMRQMEQATKSGEQKMTLQGLAIQGQERKRDSADMQDFGKGAAWAMNQPDPNAAWDQVLTQFKSEGKPVEAFVGRPDLMPMVRDLNNSDYPKQQAIQNNLINLIKTLPPGKRPQAQALGDASPQALYKAVGEGMFAGDTAGQLKALIDPLSDTQKKQVSAVYSADPDSGIKLASDLIKQKAKPKPGEKVTEGKQKAAGFAKRMVNAENIVESLQGKTPSAVERFVTQKLGVNWLASDDGQQYWNASKDWVRSKLRYESGAVIGDAEAEEEARLYFPVPGDSKAVLRQKKQLRRVATENMIEAGGAAYKVDGTAQSAVSEVSLQDRGSIKRNDKGWPLLVDSNGNRAYIGPNDEIEEL